MTEIALPGDAVDSDGDDIAGPTKATLEALYLLPTSEDLNKAGGPAAALLGPPQSVAVIESTATAFSKWWTVFLAGTGAAVWGSIVTFWDKNGGSTQRVILWAVALVSAALVLAIGYIIGSDVRGRAAATVATIHAREAVASEMIRSAAELGAIDRPGQPPVITPIPDRNVSYTARPSNDEQGWRVLAMSQNGSGSAQDIKYLVVKGQVQAWAPGEDLDFG